MTVQLEQGLSQANLDTRKNYIGGSDANILMNGTSEDIYNLYLQKIGEASGPDLDWVLPVQIGVQTEPLNVKWFIHETGHTVLLKDKPVVCKHHDFRRATLDGWLPNVPAILECKHVNQFAKINEVVTKYTPQLTHNMSVCGVARSFLSVFIGTFNYDVVPVDLDPLYASHLLEREMNFWMCVQSKTPPEGFDPVAAAEPISEFRDVDMTGNNQWASSAADWIENKDAAKTFETSKEDLKALVERDVGKASGHGVQIKRDKAGSLRFSKTTTT